MSVLSSPEYVSSGSRMTWTGQFSSGRAFNEHFAAPWDVGSIIAAVTSSLANKYQLVVEKSVDNISSIGFGGGSITLSLRTDIDRGDGENDDGLTDILNNVNDEFRAESTPFTNAVINNYTPPADPQQTGGGAPKSGTTINTGVPLATVDQQDAAKPTASNTHWYDSFLGKLEAGSVGVLIGAAVVVGLVIAVVVHGET